MKDDRLSSKECAERLKALADEDRLKIVQRAAQRPEKRERDRLGPQGGYYERLAPSADSEARSYRRDGKAGPLLVYRLHPDVFEATRTSSDCLDLGCCKLELPK